MTYLISLLFVQFEQFVHLYRGTSEVKGLVTIAVDKVLIYVRLHRTTVVFVCTKTL